MMLGGVGGKAGGKFAEAELKLGKGAGKAAEHTARATHELSQARLAENLAAKGEGAAAAPLTTEAAEAAVKADAAKAAALETKVADAGAKAQLGTEATAKGTGIVAGAVAGVAAGHYVTGENGIGAVPVVQAAEKKVDEAVDAVVAVTNEAVPVAKSTGAAVGAAIQNTNTEVLDAAKDMGNKANDLGNQVVDTVMPNPTPKP